MSIISDLLYLPLDIPNPPLEEVNALTQIPLEKLFWDDYRTCWMMPLYIDLKSDNCFTWTPFADFCPNIKKWIEDHIIPITGDTRIVIIVTPSGTRNAPHIDCAPEMFNTLQHKFRYVLRGNIDDLLFLDKDGNNKNPISVDKPFIMSGKWPHEMTNTYDETKYTLAVGAPWEADESDKTYAELIQRSYDIYKEYYLSSEDMDILDGFKELFEKSELSLKERKDAYFQTE